jgi:glucosamine-6-phosphate deaminase
MIRVRIFDTPAVLARVLAGHIARLLAAQPTLVLGLATGRTPIPLYRELVRQHAAGRADFSRATTFNLDEFLGVSATDPRSYRAFMKTHLFDHVNLSPRRIHFLNGAVAPGRDVLRECDRYERAIERAGGIDVQILGLGINGHIGFNEPARALVARTHCTRLKPGTRRANAPLFGNRVGAVPREALSMGMATILHAKRIVLLATGSSKARCVERMIEGPVTPRLPASFLQLNRNVEVWLDRAAAAGLGGPKRAALHRR